MTRLLPLLLLLTALDAGASTLTNGLVEYWPLDVNGNGVLGTENLAAQNAPSFVAGSGVSLNGTDQYMLGTTNGALASTGSLTISAWVKFSKVPTTNAVIVGKSSGDYSTCEYYLDWETDNHWYFGYNSTGAVSEYVGIAGIPATNQWYHLTGWLDTNSATINLTIDGLASASKTSGGTTIGDRAKTFALGELGASGLYPTPGIIGKVGVWNRVLTFEEINTLGICGITHPWSTIPPPSTLTAASASYADVSAAIASACNGDTVAIPAGSATWSSTLTTTRPLTIAGAGTNATFITVNVPNPGGIEIQCGLHAQNDITISNITWIGSAPSQATDPAINLDSPGFTNRITACVFTNCFKAVIGTTFGVVDHCAFRNNHLGVQVRGNNCANWTAYYPIPFNSLNYFFVENCSMTIDANMDSADYGSSHAFMSANSGSSYVVRHNTFTWSKDTMAPAFDWHGDQPGDPSRGNLSAQVYANTFTGTSTAQMDKFVDARGGQSLIYSNTVVLLSTGDTNRIDYREEWPLGTTMCGGTWTDSVTNAFDWANTINGVPMGDYCDENCGSVTYTNVALVPLLAPVYPHPLDTTPIPPNLTNTLVVTSTNPGSGVSITAAPADNLGNSNGVTPFTRYYNTGTSVTLAAPPAAAGNGFSKWQTNGVDASASTIVIFPLNANTTATAIYTNTPAPPSGRTIAIISGGAAIIGGAIIP